jgi:hypothetical protein
MKVENIAPFIEHYRQFSQSDEYRRRQSQKAIVPVLREVIRVTLNQGELTNQHLTDWIQAFKYNTTWQNFEAKLMALVKDDETRARLLDQCRASGQTGYTLVGKTAITGLSPNELAEVRQFLLDAFQVNTRGQAVDLCRRFDARNIPQVKKGIYSPWLHYIQPSLFPIINTQYAKLNDWLGLSDDYPSALMELGELNDQLGESDFGGLDAFAYQLSSRETTAPLARYDLGERRIYKISHGFFVKHAPFRNAGMPGILEERNWIALHRYTKKGAGNTFMNQLKIGDIVYVCYGGDRLHCIGQVSSNWKPFPPDVAARINDTNEEWIYREIEPLFYPKSPDLNNLKSSRAAFMPSANTTLREIPKARLKEANDKLFIPKYEVEIRSTGYSEIDQLSTTNEINNTTMALNSILYGPPGTGKTFNSIAYAVAFIEGRTIEQIEVEERHHVRQQYESYVRNKQVIFCTFHQSMSYEDFVEGIRPDLNGDEDEESLRYELKDGVFKRLAVEAAFELASDSMGEDNDEVLEFSAAYDRFLSEVDERISAGQFKEIETRNGGHIHVTNVTKRKNLEVRHQDGERDYTISKSRLAKLSEAFPDIDSISNVDKEFRDIIGGSNSTAYWAVLKAIRLIMSNEMREGQALSDREYSYEEKREWISKLALENFKGDGAARYVLIIDEINRGNVSQIFGELITLLEDDKRLGRDEALRVKLPYSEYEFGVPSNLAIIGTMNTADRSVEALDTALRRRFSFVPMLPDPTKLNVTTDGLDLPSILSTLNRRLRILKDADHTIGHAWLMGVNNLDGLKRVFADKILPLLQEYFFNDYTKLGLVLGDAFFKTQEKVSEKELASFKGSDGLAGEYTDSWKFELKAAAELTLEDFKTLEQSAAS